MVLYDALQSGPPLASYDLTAFLAVGGKKEEADLEGGALLNGVAYWAGSHGTDKKGRFQLARHCFFGTRIRWDGEQLSVTPVGRPFRGLVETLAADTNYFFLDLTVASQTRVKTPGSLNLEALAVGPGESLLLGFRSPLYQRKAVVALVLNPAAVIQGEKPTYGKPLLLDLGGSGIRDLAYGGGSWLVLSGASGTRGAPGLFQWNALEAQPQRVPAPVLLSYNPEGIVVHDYQSGKWTVQCISDDDDKSGGPGRFRSVILSF